MALTQEDIDIKLCAEVDSALDLAGAWSWIRYAYGNAYLMALGEEELDIKEARARERFAWARLPI